MKSLNPSVHPEPLGIDAATTELYQSLVGSPRHRWFIQRIETLSRDVVSGSAPPPADAKLVIVPGAFYRENPRSGADGHVVREQAERLGWQTDLIPIASTGSLQENAAIICRWLAGHRQSRIVLVSLSKGGPDVKMALHQACAESAFQPVVAWISLCGLLDGTPIADWLFSRHFGAWLLRQYFRLRGAGLGFAHDLRRGPGTPLDCALGLPQHIQMISVAGFPLTRHLTNGIARRWHRRLAPFGPNDGALVLADVCALPGFVYPIWGGDHYLRSGADMRQLIGALLKFVGQELSACASPPLAKLVSQ